MAIFIKRGEVIGYKVGEKVYHLECYKKAKKPPIADDVVTHDELEGYPAICDMCGEEIE